jgi:hypothetical protein
MSSVCSGHFAWTLVCALPILHGMKLSMRLLFGALLLSVLSTTTAAAKPKHWHDDDKHWNKHWRDHDDDRDDVHHDAASCYFQRQDIRVIREYYEPRYRSLPPGLAKKYYRTGHLPPGWQKKMEPLPVEVERRLVVLPPDYRRGYIDGSVVVYSPRTQVMIDVVTIFRP